MATEPRQPVGESTESTDRPITELCPAPASAPITGAVLEAEDTWMTFGLGVEGAEEDRTVTVVFSDPTDDSTDFPGTPFNPVFPDAP